MKKLILLSALFIFACSSDDSNNNDNNSNNDDRELYSIITINNVATPAEFRYDFAGNTTMLYIPQEEKQTTGSHLLSNRNDFLYCVGYWFVWGKYIYKRVFAR